MHVLKRFLWFCGGAALAALLLAALGPVRLTVALGPVPAVDAAPPADLPTGTPPPPTATAAPPTATSAPVIGAPPTATAVPPSPTAPPPTVAPTATPPRATQPPLPTMPPPTQPPAPSRSRPHQPPVQTAEPTATPASGIPALRLDKRADQASITAGERVTFTLSATNHGTASAADVVITDALPPAFAVVDLHSSKGDIVVSGQTVSAYPVDLAPGETVVIRIVATLREGYSGAVQNSALITSSTPGDDPDDNTSSVRLTALPPAQVAQRLPVTAAPGQPTGFLAIYWPLLVLALGIVLFGTLLRAGLLRPAQIQVQLGGSAAPPQTLDLDTAALLERWRRGATIAELGAAAAQANPHADPLLTAQAVQQLISAAVRRGSAPCDQ